MTDDAKLIERLREGCVFNSEKEQANAVMLEAADRIEALSPSSSLPVSERARELLLQAVNESRDKRGDRSDMPITVSPYEALRAIERALLPVAGEREKGLEEAAKVAENTVVRPSGGLASSLQATRTEIARRIRSLISSPPFDGEVLK